MPLTCTRVNQETGKEEVISGVAVGNLAAAHAPTTGEQACLALPLHGAAPLATWRSLCLVCSSWAAALRTIPLILDMSPVKDLACPHLLRWLCSVHVVRLKLNQKQRPGPILGSREFLKRRGPLLAALAAVADSASWQPAAYPGLPLLALDCGHSSLGGGFGEEQVTSEAVAGMQGLQHLQFNRFVRVSALQHLPLSLASLTLNLPEGSSVAECKELPRGLCLQSLEVVAAGVAINWADLCRTQRCTVSGSAMLSIQVPALPSVPDDPYAAEQAVCRRLAAGLEAGGCRQLQLASGAPVRILWPNPRLSAKAQGGPKDKAKGKANGGAKRAQQEPPFEGVEMSLGAVASMMQQSGLLHTMQIGGGTLPDDGQSEVLLAERLPGGQRALTFQQPLSAAQAAQLTGAGAPPVAALSFCEGGTGDPASADVLGSPSFAAASGGLLKQAMHVVVRSGLSLAPYTALERLYALLPGPLPPGALPPSLVDVKLTCLPSFPAKQRRFSAAQALAGNSRLLGLRLQGWAEVDVSSMPRSVKALTVLLPELPPAAVLGAPGGPLRLPPVGHVLDMLGVRLKPSGRPAGGAAGGMAFQVVDSGSSLSMSSNATKFNLTELVQRAKVVVVEGRAWRLSAAARWRSWAGCWQHRPCRSCRSAAPRWRLGTRAGRAAVAA